MLLQVLPILRSELLPEAMQELLVAGEEVKEINTEIYPGQVVLQAESLLFEDREVLLDDRKDINYDKEDVARVNNIANAQILVDANSYHFEQLS